MTLARAGMRVVVLEEGRRHTTAEFGRRAPLDRFADLYRDGGATVALGNPPVRAARRPGRRRHHRRQLRYVLPHS